jgi:putative transposase
MPNYRRSYVPGGTYFFTVVTCQRRPILTTDVGRRALREAIEAVQADWPFQMFASVLLPDHFHCVWILPSDDADYSVRWGRIKDRFTRAFLKAGGEEAIRSLSRHKHRERAVWQRRFWEHTVRDEDDLRRCVDYIHWNPVRHGHVVRPVDWAWSTFRRFVESGDYPANWGEDGPIPDVTGAEWE